MKDVYRPMLNQRSAQNAPPSWFLSPINLQLAPANRLIGLLLAIGLGTANACGLRDNGATMLDPVTRIEIQKCPLGTTWQTGGCNGQEQKLKVDEAVSRFGGSAGVWRLITAEEAISIGGRSKNCPLGLSWTSSTLVPGFPPANFELGGAFVNFEDPVVRPGYYAGPARATALPVRLIRVGGAATTAVVSGIDRSTVAGQSGNTTSGNTRTGSTESSQSQQNQSTQQQSQQAQQQAQQSRAAQQQSQQAVFNSAQNQTAADQTRKSERRRHEPENEAHDCLSLDKSGLFGGIVNKCDFKVAYQFCNFNPKKDSWAESHTCGKSGSADFVGAGRTSAAHVKNTETVYWFACKDPAWPLDVEYVAGKGIQARCYTIGGK